MSGRRYRTFAKLGGLNDAEIEDAPAAAASLPAVDSIDVSSLLLGEAADDGAAGGGSAAHAAPPGARARRASAPRTEVPLGSCANARNDPFCQGADPGATVVSGLVAKVDGFDGLCVRTSRATDQRPLEPQTSRATDNRPLEPTDLSSLPSEPATSPMASARLSSAVPSASPSFRYKLLVGWVPLDCTTGPAYPPKNGSHAECPSRECGPNGFVAIETEPVLRLHAIFWPRLHAILWPRLHAIL